MFIFITFSNVSAISRLPDWYLLRKPDRYYELTDETIDLGIIVLGFVGDRTYSNGGRFVLRIHQP